MDPGSWPCPAAMPADGGMQSAHPPSGAGLTGIAEKLLSQCPVVVTGLLILARAIFESLGLPAPTVVEILAATHVSRSTAYETHDVLVELLPTLIRARGRPAVTGLMWQKTVFNGAFTQSAAV